MRRTPFVVAAALGLCGALLAAPASSQPDLSADLNAMALQSADKSVAPAAVPAAPGTIVEPLGTGPACLTQTSFGTEFGNPGNFDLVVLQGTSLVHYWHDNSDPALAWHRGEVITQSASAPGCLIQSDFDGNLEVVVPEGDQVAHYFRSAGPMSTWQRAQSFGAGVTGQPSIIQSSIGSGTHGNFEAVVPEGDSLVHYFHDAGGWQRGQVIATGVHSSGSIIQSTFGDPGNFEVVALAEEAAESAGAQVAGGYTDYELVHYFHNNGDNNNPWRRGQIITHRARSEKVCQATGSYDRERGGDPAVTNTTNDTAKRVNLSATDLGYPVDDGEALTVLFGDSRWGDGGLRATSEWGYDDAVAVSRDTAAPTATNCLHLTFETDANGDFRPPRVQPDIMQGLFNVPSSGFAVGSQHYAIFWTNHCDFFNDDCDPAANEQGRAVLTKRVSETYQQLFELPAQFRYTASINTADGVYVYGVDTYRGGNPYLAHVPSGQVEDQAAWRYFAGLDAAGAPQWSADSASAVPVFDSGDPQPCIGEFGVTWEEPLQRWLMTYNCTNGVQARLATTPWGSWSAPSTIFHPGEDAGLCRFMHDASQHCDNLAGDNGDAGGGSYGPYVMSRFTQPAGPGAATIYYLMSTWNPYQVVVMRSTITAP